MKKKGQSSKSLSFGVLVIIIDCIYPFFLKLVIIVYLSSLSYDNKLHCSLTKLLIVVYCISVIFFIL